MVAYSIKCYYRCNHCEERDKIINNGVSSNECTRCRENETWEFGVQYRSIVSIREEFILKLHKDLKKVQVEGVLDEKLRSFIEDMSKYLREDTEDQEMNQ